MQTQTRLENLLRRTRKNAVTDLFLAAFFVAVMAFAGVWVGRSLPMLTSAPAASEVATTTRAPAPAATPTPASSTHPFFHAAA